MFDVKLAVGRLLRRHPQFPIGPRLHAAVQQSHRPCRKRLPSWSRISLRILALAPHYSCSLELQMQGGEGTTRLPRHLVLLNLGVSACDAAGAVAQRRRRMPTLVVGKCTPDFAKTAVKWPTNPRFFLPTRGGGPLQRLPVPHSREVRQRC
jgi:hypothetical protein